MRAISLVNRIEFEFMGNVVRNALCLGDADNDGSNELIVGNKNGDVVIFKGREKVQTLSKLSFISCIAVGDVLNHNKNSLVLITADGWCYIYESQINSTSDKDNEDAEEIDSQMYSSPDVESPPSVDFDSNLKDANVKETENTGNFVCIHVQRIPANAKNILLGDVDGDGMTEMVLGLTDRVVRSYKWFGNNNKPTNSNGSNISMDPLDKSIGKFVAMNKWECANQIGSITLHHSWDEKPSLLIAQPGGTFMRIKCQSDDSSSQNLENSELSNSNSSQGETIPGSVDYQFLGLSRMRNQNISTEILGDFKCTPQNLEQNTDSKSNSNMVMKGKPYAVATLDGTIMLVQDEVILWAMAVDHQIFALTKLDITGNGFDDILACSWDGQTYILDQDKNSIRFPLEEPVQAFTSGYYNLEKNSAPVTCLVYVTFKNSVILYYDIPIKELVSKKFEPNFDKLSELFSEEGRVASDNGYLENMDKKTRKELIKCLLYNVKS